MIITFRVSQDVMIRLDGGMIPAMRITIYSGCSPHIQEEHWEDKEVKLPMFKKQIAVTLMIHDIHDIDV